jgi:hypothetical protein
MHTARASEGQSSTMAKKKDKNKTKSARSNPRVSLSKGRTSPQTRSRTRTGRPATRTGTARSAAGAATGTRSGAATGAASTRTSLGTGTRAVTGKRRRAPDRLTGGKGRSAGKGVAQMTSKTRMAVEDQRGLTRGGTDFSRTANKTIYGHRSATDRKMQRKRDVQNATGQEMVWD